MVQVRPPHRHRRTRQVHLHVQQHSEVTIRHQETVAIHPKTPNNNNKRDINRASDDSLLDLQNGWRSLQIILKMQRCLHPHTFLTTQIRNVLQKCSSRSTIFWRASHRTVIAKYADKPRGQGLLLQKTHFRSSTSSRKIGDLITADHKVFNEEGESGNNHRYAVVLQDLATQRIQSYPCKTKLLRRWKRVYESFSSRHKGQESLLRTIHWNLANAVKSYTGIILPQRLTVPKQLVLQEEQYAESRKELLQ